MLRKKQTIGIWPMRANPVHYGHLKNLLKVKDQFDKVYVCVSDNTYDGEKTQLMTANRVVTELTETLGMISDKYTVIFSKERFITRTRFDDLPSFDVVITGNDLVAKNMRKQGIKILWVPRIPFWYGTFIREAYMKGMAYERQQKK